MVAVKYVILVFTVYAFYYATKNNFKLKKNKTNKQ